MGMEKELQERQKQVIEAEKKVQVLKQRMQQVEARGRSYNTDGRRAQFTEAELKTVTDNANVYKAVGRMFVLRPAAELIEEQQDRQKLCQEEVNKALQTAETLTKSHSEAETEFEKLYTQFLEEVKLLQKN
eukprot:TRINITY_DN4451_c0_g2_i1.p1 TRINITY_DN4451_c0_g2~~TRINITY_DN4451_c0_g2_i1.p1  ORF type:complete len:131 (+),score=79.09 TRINITY_DN4451_c0_g2_i1:60-452(+)